MLDLMKLAPRTTGELCDSFPELELRLVQAGIYMKNPSRRLNPCSR